MLTGNKGEWSEIYALLKLLGDSKLFIGDEDLTEVPGVYYPIIKIIRNEAGINHDYYIEGDNINISNSEQNSIPRSLFLQKAEVLFNCIKSGTGSFNCSEIEEFMNSISCYTVKAKSTTKTDISIVIYDSTINQTAELGFSIKSHLGSDSTLLNAGITTNFIYRVENYQPDKLEIERINQIDTRSKIRDRIEAIKSEGGSLNFTTLRRDIFKNNLVLIDSLMPEILAALIEAYFTTNLNSIEDLTAFITKANPLNYDYNFAHTFYEYKIKRFLTDVALGMMPSVVWSGKYDSTGGYLIVKDTGDILCYHIYHKNKFEDYLFKNTRLETASSTRHEFGKIYRENESLFFDLNLQIRFT